MTSDVSRTRSAVEAARIDAEDGEPRSRALRLALALARLSIGWVFLWAFFDKLLALGVATSRDQETGVVDWFGPTAWINGGSPTEGFLGNATKGPLAGLYSSFAGAAWADWLFMAGLLGIGAGLMLGIAMRLSCGFGALLLLLMWSAALPPDNNPFMDDHIVYALVLVALALAHAGRTLGLGRLWEQLPVVQSVPLLR